MGVEGGEMKNERKQGVVFFTATAVISLLLAQLGSYLVESYLTINRSVELFSFLHLTHVRNMGGIFGIMQGKGWFFTIMSGLVLSGLIYYIIRYDGIRRYEYVCYGLIAGGGLSNIADRLIYGSVIDYVDVQGIAFWNYIFNLADMLIHMGIWPLLLVNINHMVRSKKAQAVPS